MNGPLSLFQSRKFWVGIVTVVATIGAVYLRAKNLIPADALVPTILSMSGVGIGLITGIAIEDAAAKRADSFVRFLKESTAKLESEKTE